MSGIRHAGILVSNINESLRIYRDVLGFEEIERKTLHEPYMENLLNWKDITLTFSKLRLKGCKTLLELWKIEGLVPSDYTSISHISITVNDLQDIYNKLKERGIQFLSEPLKSPYNKVKVCFCKDFDQNLIELVEEIKSKKLPSK
jgi:catechol 2,3-dioxygenase-like lactoylglutathione lyase family enzyme